MFTKTVPSLVSITLSSGVEINVYSVLDEKPTRLNQKIKTLTQYIQQYPSGWKKRLELANLLSVTGHWEQAIKEYQQIIKRQPQFIEVQLKLAKMLHLMGQEADAAAVYENALSHISHQATRQHIKGLIALCNDNFPDAIEAFKSAISLESNNPAHWLALGRVQMETEDTSAALQAFDQVLSLYPDDLVALIESYDALIALGNVQQAQEQLNQLITLAPDDFQVLKRQIENRYRMRWVLGEGGKQTKQMINSVLELTPPSTLTYELQAYYHIFRGDWAQGLRVLATFAEEHPHNPVAWYQYGQGLFYTGQYQTAAQVMLKLYRLYPKDCAIYRALCAILPLADSPSVPLLLTEESQITLVSIVQEMLERFPDRWSVWTTAGRVLVESLQEIEQGCCVSQQGTQLQPQLADAWFQYGRVLALAGKHPEAIAALETGWQFLPETGGYLQSMSAAVWLGESYQALGEAQISRYWWEEACQHSQRLRGFDPVIADYWQGRALEGLGDGLGAIPLYRNALTQQLLYPARQEVEASIKRLKISVRKRYRK